MNKELHTESLTGAERWRKEGGRAERTELWEAEVLSRDFVASHPKGKKKKKNTKRAVSSYWKIKARERPSRTRAIEKGRDLAL